MKIQDLVTERDSESMGMVMRVKDKQIKDASRADIQKLQHQLKTGSGSSLHRPESRLERAKSPHGCYRVGE